MTPRLAALVLVLAAAQTAYAHTGRTAVALPVSGIVVDGDLSDWPEHLKSYELRPYDDDTARPIDAKDAWAQFRVGFDRAAGHLYVALRVIDDSIVLQGDVGPSWTAQDSCEVFVDVEHRAAMNQPAQLFFRREPGAYPATRQKWATVARASGPGEIRFEWRIDLAELRGAALPAGPLVIGFDVAYQDRDTASDVSSVMWSPGADKWQNSLDLGDLVLLDREVPFGSIAGATAWDAPGSMSPPGYAHISRAGEAGFFVLESTDDTGRFVARVPPGDYEVRAADPRTSVALAAARRVTVSAGARTETVVVARRAASLDELLPTLLNGHNVPGVTLAVIEDGKVSAVKAIGKTDRGGPATVNTVFRVASLTKPVSTVIAYKLMAREMWNLDEPLAKHWVDPDVNGDPRHRLITSRMALQHHTGFPNWRGSSRLAFQFDPGARWQYSGEGFEYMRRALERKTGRSLEDWAKELVFEPLGMTSTSFVWPAWVDGRYAGEHLADGSPLPSYFKPIEPNAAANMVATVGDYARFAVHVLEGAGLPPTLFDDMTSPHVRPANTNIDGELWGVGWGVLRENDPRDRLIWHSGGQPGMRTIVFLQPARKRGVIVFTNATGGNPIIAAVATTALNQRGDLSTLDALLVRMNRIPR